MNLAQLLSLLFISITLLSSCDKKEKEEPVDNKGKLEIGGDFSIMKKLEDSGGKYKIDGMVKEGFQIFKDNGYTRARLRIFHTPNMQGPVCNDLDYTIALAQKAKQFGFKIFLNFHYSDTWADPGKQWAPKAWENLALEGVADSVYEYTKATLNAMNDAGVMPELVQVGNEINNGMVWPYGKLWQDDGTANWDDLATLLKAGIRGVKDAESGSNIPIMIHAATGGDLIESNNFYKNIINRGVEFDVIGLSYYPWWHGTFDELEENLEFLSKNYAQDLSLVETAYYSNGWYPDPNEGDWILDVKPYPPTEQGQYDFMVELKERLEKYPKVKSVYYWKPDGLDIPGSGVHYLGRSLFSRDGNAFKGISAWKPVE